MIQALHRAGFKVIMDVVYNHMYSADNWFERMVPGYFCRRTDDGALANGSGCGCDMASEHAMFGRYIVDSVTYWAREYHIDGFRFDLMGLIDVETMNAVRASVDALPDGRRILLYGEPWSAADSAVEPGTNPVEQGRRGPAGPPYRLVLRRHARLDQRTRAVLRSGRVRQRTRPGVRPVRAQGGGRLARRGGRAEGPDAAGAVRLRARRPDAVGQAVRHDVPGRADGGGLRGLRRVRRGGRGSGGSVGGGAADDAVGGETGGCHGDVADMLAANAMAAGLVMTAAGLPFLLSGEEFARTKLGCSDSFDRPASLNLLDWRRAVRMAPLVDWYRTLIALRRSHPELCRGAHVPLPSADDVVAYRVGDLVLAANAGYGESTLDMTGGAASDGEWAVVADSTDALAGGPRRRLPMPKPGTAPAGRPR